MSVNDLVGALENFSLYILAVFVVIPLFTFAYGKIVKKPKGNFPPHKYVYSTLIYLSCVPGMFAAVLCAYIIFIQRSDLLDLNIVVYFVPIITMIVTMVIVSNDVELEYIPGIERLLGFFIVLGVTFTIILFVLKTRIFVFFGGSIIGLVIFGVLMFLLLKFGIDKVMKGKDAS
jgi:hypothetical protein